MKIKFHHLVFGLTTTFSFFAQATGLQGVDIQTLDELNISAVQTQLKGNAVSASVGTITSDQLEHRPLLRPAEVMETVPGLIVTQHSGDGKANQYFLRGFNLDHGTDFSSFVDGMPVNLVTHGHGQGYTDLNFLIPELVNTIIYKKGPYYAEEGDFSSAGSGRISLKDQLDSGIAKMTIGADNYLRFLAMDETPLGDGILLGAIEYQQTDGPWELTENLSRKNLVVKYSQEMPRTQYNISAMVYEADWVATDQIPQRLVNNGTIDRFGYVTDTAGGDTHRYSLSTNLNHQLKDSQVKANAYVIDYALRLTSNFTYFLNDPVAGDEFTQMDDRTIWGGAFSWHTDITEKNELEVGLQLRHDDIHNVSLGPSQNGVNTSYTVRNKVSETASAAYASILTHWQEGLSTTVGIRYDRIGIDVKGVAKDNDGIFSPKFGIQFGPWKDTEFFINYGKSFHSNDARGVVATVDPVPLFAKSEGAEIGLRTAILKDTQISFAMFALDLDSELVFVGDEGTTEAQGATRRTGWELGVYYQPHPWIIVDADITESRAFFKDEPNGFSERVPDAAERVMSLGISADFPSGWHGGLRWRYLGGRALTEDNSIRSESTSLLNLNSGYQFDNGLSLQLQVINLLDTEANDITYLFESRTSNELAAGVTPEIDQHFHPVEPRTFRLTMSYEF